MPRSLTASLGGRDDHTSFHGSNSRLNLNLTESPPNDVPRSVPSARTSDIDLHRRLPRPPAADETTGLLAASETRSAGYRTQPPSVPGTPRVPLARWSSYAASLRSARAPFYRSRRSSFSSRVARALGADANQTAPNDPAAARSSLFGDDRVWYDQFTSTDWVHDSIADAFRVKELRARKDWRGRLVATLDGGQGWLLMLIIGVFTAAFAYFIDELETTLFDYKEGYCTADWRLARSRCCNGATICDDWRGWSEVFVRPGVERIWIDFAAFVAWVVVLSLLACLITLQTKTSISSAISLSTLDENLAADHHDTKADNEGGHGGLSPQSRFEEAARRPPMVYYPAAGSGVAEVKVILSGFVLHGYLGVRTLFCKTFGLILSVASGLSIGKEGPYVHIATCLGNVACRLFPKYRDNDGKRREVLAAAAAAGVAVAFGAPIGGVLFSLEEVSYYFPHKTLFRTFFCCIAAALSLKALDPYGTGKIVLFEVRYLLDWKFFEIFVFVLVGIMGGFIGAMFIKASRFWAKHFRSVAVIKKYPILEVLIVAFITGAISFWNRYTRIPVAQLLFELSTPCSAFTDTGFGLCPTQERIPQIIWYLCMAFLVKLFLTVVSFGMKVPAGIYVPSMVVGGLLGRIVGHLVQLLILSSPSFGAFVGCPVSDDAGPESCVVPGVYALVAAGATMCGVTRLSVTLAVILFELTGSLEHVLPFSVGVLVAKWTADALEPLSIYDLLTDMNAYPYLDSKVRPVFTTELGDIAAPLEPERFIDLSASPLVPARHLRQKVDFLHMAGELDGGLPILRHGILVGLIPCPDLEYALDGIADEPAALCLMSPQHKTWLDGRHRNRHEGDSSSFSGGDDDDEQHESDPFTTEAQPLSGSGFMPADPTDFTAYIDPAPVSLDVSSSMDLVFECFVKLGLRHICVLREGKCVGLVHKKAFVRYVKEVHQGRDTGRA